MNQPPPVPPEWEALRVAYLVLSSFGMAVAVFRYRWFLRQSRRTRMLLMALGLYTVAAIVAALELLQGIPDNGLRIYVTTVASLTTVVGLVAPAERDD